MKLIENIIYDLKSLLDCIKSYYNARKGKKVMICIFRGVDNDKQALDYFKALNEMEKKLPFPIINKKGF